MGGARVVRAHGGDVELLLGRLRRAVGGAEASAYLDGATVLVTGAAGSIGAELCRRLAGAGATRLVLVEQAEGPLVELTGDLDDAETGRPGARGRPQPAAGDRRARAVPAGCRLPRRGVQAGPAPRGAPGRSRGDERARRRQSSPPRCGPAPAPRSSRPTRLSRHERAWADEGRGSGSSPPPGARQRRCARRSGSATSSTPPAASCHASGAGSSAAPRSRSPDPGDALRHDRRRGGGARDRRRRDRQAQVVYWLIAARRSGSSTWPRLARLRRRAGSRSSGCGGGAPPRAAVPRGRRRDRDRLRTRSEHADRARRAGMAPRTCRGARAARRAGFVGRRARRRSPTFTSRRPCSRCRPRCCDRDLRPFSFDFEDWHQIVRRRLSHDDWRDGNRRSRATSRSRSTSSTSSNVAATFFVAA